MARRKPAEMAVPYRQLRTMPTSVRSARLPADLCLGRVRRLVAASLAGDLVGLLSFADPFERFQEILARRFGLGGRAGHDHRRPAIRASGLAAGGLFADLQLLLAVGTVKREIHGFGSERVLPRHST